MRLIDADSFRNEWLENGENEYVYDTNSVLDSIDEQPTVDAVPVVHGRWERNIVIKCGLKHHEGFNASCCGRWSKYRTLYCPNCGATMDGGNDG